MTSLQARLYVTACFALLCTLPASAAECPVTHINDAVAAIKNASSCDVAVALYEACGARVTEVQHMIDLSGAARERCEKDFISALHDDAHRFYKMNQSKCYDAFIKRAGAALPMFYFPQNHCGPYLAQSYQHAYAKRMQELAKNPNPPL